MDAVGCSLKLRARMGILPCSSQSEGHSPARVAKYPAAVLSGWKIGEERKGFATLGLLSAVAGAWLLRAKRARTTTAKRRCRPEEEIEAPTQRENDGSLPTTESDRVDALAAQLENVIGLVEALRKELVEAKVEAALADKKRKLAAKSKSRKTTPARAALRPTAAKQATLPNEVVKESARAVSADNLQDGINKQTSSQIARHEQDPSQAQHNDVGAKSAPDGITVVQTVEAARAVVKKLYTLGNRVHAVDTEVMGWRKDRSPYTCGTVFAFSIYCGDDVDFGTGPRLFIDDLDGSSKPRGVMREFKAYLEDVDIKKVLHNYSYDKAVLQRSGIRLDGLIGDTMHMVRLLPRRGAGPVSLAELTKEFLDEEYHKDNLMDVTRRLGYGFRPSEPEKMHLSMDNRVRKAWERYTALDTVATLKLYEELRDKLQTQGVLHTYENYWVPFAKQLCEMEEAGVPISVERLRELKAVAEQDEQDAHHNFYTWLAEKWQDDEELMQSVNKVKGTNHEVVRHLLYGTEKTAIGKAGTTIVQGMRLPCLVEKDEINWLSVLDLARTCRNRLAPADLKGLYALAHWRTYMKKPHDRLAAVEEVWRKTAINDRVYPGWSFILPGGGVNPSRVRLDRLKELSATRWPQSDSADYLSMVTPEEGKAFVRAQFRNLDVQIVSRLSACESLHEVFGGADGDVPSRIAEKMFHGVDAQLHEDWDQAEVAESITNAVLRGVRTDVLAEILDISASKASELKRLWHAAFPEVLAWCQARHHECLEDESTGRAFLLSPHGRSAWTRKAELKEAVLSDDASLQPYLVRLVQLSVSDLNLEVVGKASRLAELDYRLIMYVQGEFTFEGPAENLHDATEAVGQLLRGVVNDHWPWPADHCQPSDVIISTEIGGA
mmetsp:Transcript_2578/g.6571  ORF Transcript_2578/g.6571 Transcript_2578/m.6571 type:complete len:891 (-) Transcript_2578:63-2735(-)